MLSINKNDAEKYFNSEKNHIKIQEEYLDIIAINNKIVNTVVE